MTSAGRSLVCVLAFGLLAGCGGSDEGDDETGPPPLRLGQVAPWPTDEWTELAPEKVGMDSVLLEEAFGYAFDGVIPPSIRGADDPERHPGEMFTQGVVVIRGGALVAERYAASKDKAAWAASWSAAKSFTSSLIGILIDRGEIPSVDEPLTTFYPEWEGTDKAPITLRDVLQMQSGLEFREDYFDPSSEMLKMGTSPDELAFMIDRTVHAPPGTRWHYSSGDTMLLSGIIQRITGKNAFEFGSEVLFNEIGMLNQPTEWWEDGADHTLGYCCLDTPTRNFARFGLLFLRDGKWDQKQVISSEWVQKSTEDVAQGFQGYAYQWWLAEQDGETKLPLDMYAAEGQDDQIIYVIPSLDLVVVRNSMYDKPPTEPIAENGFIGEFLPFGVGTYGTESGQFWLDCPFLAPIINSIEGAPKIDACNVKANGCAEPNAACTDRASHYDSKCASAMSCVCNVASAEFIACDDDCGCREIVQCAIETGCIARSAVDCVQDCDAVLQKHGGVSGISGTLAFDLSLKIASCDLSCAAQ
jgi:CubicO group peptidase (beta-lactamase class C family)